MSSCTSTTASRDTRAWCGARLLVLDGPGGFLLAPWCGSAECETAVSNENGATIRVVPFDSPDEAGKCVVDGKPSERRVLFARSY